MYLHTNIAASTDSGCKMYLSFSEMGGNPSMDNEAFAHALHNKSEQ